MELKTILLTETISQSANLIKASQPNLNFDISFPYNSKIYYRYPESNGFSLRQVSKQEAEYLKENKLPKPDYFTLNELFNIPQRKHIDVPDKLLILGAAARRKIVRAYESSISPLKLDSPIQTQFSHIFRHLYDNPPINDIGFVKDISCGMWPHRTFDEALALYLHFGHAYSNSTKMLGPAIYRLEPLGLPSPGPFPSIGPAYGVHVEINPRPTPFHTLNYRIKKTAEELVVQFIQDIRNTKELINFAMKFFYSVDGWNISLTSTLHTIVFDIFNAYIESLLKKHKPPSFEINEPNFLAAETFTLYFSDFSINATPAQYQQRSNNASAAALAALGSLLDLLEPKKIYRRKELEALGFTRYNIDTAKKYNLLIQPKYGSYRLAQPGALSE